MHAAVGAHGIEPQHPTAFENEVSPRRCDPDGARRSGLAVAGEPDVPVEITGQPLGKALLEARRDVLNHQHGRGR